jgi:hypothetical protein
MTRKKTTLVATKPKYQPTPREQTAIDNVLARQKARGPAPRLKLNKELQEISFDHPSQGVARALLAEALGTEDRDFLNGLLSQLANATNTNEPQTKEPALNFLVSVVRGIQPRDQVEAMLAAQMAAVHAASMTFACRLAHVETLAQQDSAERAFNKLTRTFATQVEALKRYRTGGEQRVTVQHVSVSEGGQAIVGNVTQTRHETALDKAASPPALAAAPKPAMTIESEPAPAAIPRKGKPGK